MLFGYSRYIFRFSSTNNCIVINQMRQLMYVEVMETRVYEIVNKYLIVLRK